MRISAAFFNVTILSMLLLAVSPVWATTQTTQDPQPPAALTPNQIVQQISTRLSVAVKNHREEYKKDQSKLVALINRVLLPHFDESYSSILVLGRYARTATPEQIDAFQKAFYKALLDRYAAGLIHYHESRVKVLPARTPPGGRRALVRTRVKLDDGKQISVDFAFHRDTAGQWKAYDVVIEGISYVVSYRSQVGEEIRHIGLNGLIKRLQTEGGRTINKLKKPGGSRK